MKQLESLYSRLPVWAQDLAVSAQGLRYRQQRYGTCFQQELDLLCRVDHGAATQLDSLQVARLKSMLQYAAERVPYYRSRLSPRTLASLKTAKWTELLEIPITEKQPLRDHPEQFYSDGAIQPNWIAWHTSGTTGTPVTLQYCPDAVARQYAFVERYRQQAGVNRFLRRGQFTGRLIVPPGKPQGASNGRFWRYDWANQALMLSTVHLSPAAIPQYVDALRRFRPAYISGYPSAIALLAQHILRFPQDAIPLVAVLTSAETLQRSQRQAIEQAFSCHVFDQYGQTEMQSFWFECRYGNMHAHPLFGVTEILRPNGQPCLPEETGDVVLTGLINRAMPLLRYRVGDRAAWSARSCCPCGHSMPIIAGLEGRKDDYIYTEERGWVGRMDPALKGVHGIIECQFVQESLGRLEIRFVAGAEFRDADQEQLSRNLRDRLGGSISLEFRRLEQIPRGANGKFRPVVSRVSFQGAARLSTEPGLDQEDCPMGVSS